jgi:hypothetical protein
VEGYELEVFEGGRETIQRNRPVILIEIWEKKQRKILFLDSYKFSIL